MSPGIIHIIHQTLIILILIDLLIHLLLHVLDFVNRYEIALIFIVSTILLTLLTEGYNVYIPISGSDFSIFFMSKTK